MFYAVYVHTFKMKIPWDNMPNLCSDYKLKTVDL